MKIEKLIHVKIEDGFSGTSHEFDTAMLLFATSDADDGVLGGGDGLDVTTCLIAAQNNINVVRKNNPFIDFMYTLGNDDILNSDEIKQMNDSHYNQVTISPIAKEKEKGEEK